ncbi:MAG: mandelate racemase/muconate lactonizing enzyme family protein [Dehalococcoidia bacterium]|tara:strand:- start:832 stop:1875 length:1044 start_codon:yes stop_codon:yes gene_type:complete
MSKITDIKVDILKSRSKSQVITYITDSNGTVGIGEAWWGLPDVEKPGGYAKPIASVIENILAPRLLGANANNIEKHWQDLSDFGYRYGDQGIFTMGMSGIDIALWDLLGKNNNLPLTQLLGGSVHDSLPCYASLPPLRSSEIVISETKRAIKKGIKAIKLHEIETKYVDILRKEFGNSIEIMVDVNGHYNVIEAIEAGKKMKKHNITWFEEPVKPMRNYDSIKKIGTETGLPLAGGENEYTISDFKNLLEKDILMYIQPEITKIGGITVAKKLSPLFEIYNVAFCPHNFSIGPSLYASIHWAFSSIQSAWIEVPWVPENFGFDFSHPLPEIVNGRIQKPNGIGINLD